MRCPPSAADIACDVCPSSRSSLETTAYIDPTTLDGRAPPSSPQRLVSLVAIIDVFPADRGEPLLARSKVSAQISRDLTHLEFFRAFSDPVAAVMTVDMFERLVT